jgi:hypothetical protein
MRVGVYYVYTRVVRLYVRDIFDPRTLFSSHSMTLHVLAVRHAPYGMGIFLQPTLRIRL